MTSLKIFEQIFENLISAFNELLIFQLILLNDLLKIVVRI